MLTISSTGFAASSVGPNTSDGIFAMLVTAKSAAERNARFPSEGKRTDDYRQAHQCNHDAERRPDIADRREAEDQGNSD